MVIAPEHPFVSQITTDDQHEAVNAYAQAARGKSEVERQISDETHKKTGVFTGAYAINPVNDERIPVWVADYVLMSYGTGAIMAVPSGDQRDFEFARQFDLSIVPTVQPAGGEPLDGATMTAAYTGDGLVVNSGQFNGMTQSEALPKMIEWLDEQGRAKAEVSWRLRDWLISRQRYWGTPIPVVYCDSCGMVPVPEDQLPVELPLDAEFKPTGQSPLVTHESFVNTTCPQCGGSARRETDTMDTFMDSSWYWFRYASPHDDAAPFDKDLAALWNPVALYCGGIEHAILHLLYARFITRVLRDLGLTDVSEPFSRLRNQGMILAAEGTKMSKSRGTQIGPDELVARYGADALRLHLMFLGPWEQGGPWNDRGITGMERFIKRAYQVVSELGTTPAGEPAAEADEAGLIALMHRTIKRVSDDINSFSFNTMVAALIEYVNELMKLKETGIVTSPVWRDAVETLVLLMAPATPYVAEELWEMLGKPISVHQQDWPVYDPALAVEATIEIPVQINGKVRDRAVVASNATAGEQVEVAKSLPKIAEQIDGKQIVKEISVPGRMVNLVVKG
jgi:leucyl-tRNA synthetase